VTKNLTLANEEFAKAAAQGHPDAMCRLAAMCYDGIGTKKKKGGEEGETEKERARALALWHEAAALGHAASQYRLGLIYTRGLYTRKDPRAAADFFNEAAAQGDEIEEKVLKFVKNEGNGALSAAWLRVYCDREPWAATHRRKRSLELETTER